MSENATKTQIEAGGHALECAWVGEAGERVARGLPVLVFLHEGLGCVDLWRDVPEQLSRMTGLPAFSYSRAGYGGSDPCILPRPINYHQLEAEDVLPEVLDAAGIQSAILIGHSDGGTIALQAAGMEPRVKAVITMAAHVFVEAITIKGIEEARQAWTTASGAEGSVNGGGLRGRLARFHGDNVDIAFWGWNDTWLSDEFQTWNVEDCLSQITCPVLVMQGMDDHYGTQAQVDAIVNGVRGQAVSAMVPNCGHAPHLESPEQVLPAIQAFVKAVVGQAA